jgi:hypothetical protein
MFVVLFPPCYLLNMMTTNTELFCHQTHRVFAHSHIMLNMHDPDHHFQIRTLANTSFFVCCFSSSLYSMNNNPFDGATLSLPLGKCLLLLDNKLQNHLERKKNKKLFHIEDNSYLLLTIERENMPTNCANTG